MRLDAYLVETGRYATRSRAADAVRRGCVRVDGALAAKPGQKVSAPEIWIDDPAKRYVSRAALKLVAALDASGFDPAGRFCLDVGASTGGFTQVLLERGAAHVVALDVGHDQLAGTLRGDRRVTNMEGLNARDLASDDLLRTPDAVVSDVSFISLRLALPPALALAAPGAWTAMLVKPQFETGRGGIGKGGVVAPDEGERIADELRGWLDERPGWRSTHLLPSPIAGADGNREWLLCGTKS